ncbi:hypothetical protein DFH06DRAFT_1136504 [Mycena polygramma]|nr:hypothetical protein DFH06DRAFT_1136504 [Mycena polygramma]
MNFAIVFSTLFAAITAVAGLAVSEPIAVREPAPIATGTTESCLMIADSTLMTGYFRISILHGQVPAGNSLGNFWYAFYAFTPGAKSDTPNEGCCRSTWHTIMLHLA